MDKEKKNYFSESRTREWERDERSTEDRRAGVVIWENYTRTNKKERVAGTKGNTNSKQPKTAEVGALKIEKKKKRKTRSFRRARHESMAGNKPR